MTSLFSRRQRGGFVIGLVVGLLIGLALALGVALYVTKAPNPFVNKVQARTPGQDAAEVERNRNWDPNSALAGKNPASAAAVASAPTVAPPIAAVPPVLVPPTVVDPGSPNAARGARPAAATASGAATTVATRPPVPLLPGADPFQYFVQAGAYARSEDAEQQRARLAIIGIESKLTEREQGGRTVYRVRVGPFDKKEAADAAKDKLAEGGVDAALVRVQK